MILRRKPFAFRVVDWRNRAAAALAVLIVTAGPLHAGVRVSGDATAVQLNATASTVAEALSALKAAFQVRVQASMVLDRPIGGTYSGALPQILSELLQGYNYFITHHGTQIEVTVVGSQGNQVATTRRPSVAPNNSSALSLADAVRLKIH